MNIVFPDKISLSKEYIDRIKALGVQLFDDLPEVDELKSRIKDAEIITAGYIDVTPEIIDSAPRLKYIIVPAVGYEWVDVEYAAQKGVTTLNCPTYNSQAVAEHAIALLMAVNRSLVMGVDEIRSGVWNSHSLNSGVELTGKQLGLIGHGNVGKRIEKIVTSLGMSVRFVDSRSTNNEIDELVASSDFVCICAPLNDGTRHLVNKRRLESMKPSAILVNVGRGAIVDQAALIDVLKTRKIRGAGLDVFDGEPLTGTPSDEIVSIAKLPNVIATPHIAYNTLEIQDKQGDELLQNIKSCIDGKPINTVKQAGPIRE